MWFQMALNKTFCPKPQLLTHQQLKCHQRTKNNKTMLSASPSLVFQTKFTIPKLKSKWVFQPNGTELRPPVSECSTRISKFCAPPDSEHKFDKMEIENQLTMGFNLGSRWLGTCSHATTLCSITIRQSLKVLYIQGINQTL